MKKIISVVTAMALTFLLFAQNKKGNLLVGVNVGGINATFGKSQSSYSLDPTVISKSDNSGFNIELGPTIGYYVSDNVVVGAMVNLGFYSEKNTNSNTGGTATSVNKNHYVYVNLAPYCRFYFGSNNGKGMPFAEINTGVSFYPGEKGSNEPSSGNTGYTYSYSKYVPWNAGVKIGYEHFINPVIGIQYYIGYSYSSYQYTASYDYENGQDYSSTYKNTSNDINFGAALVIHLQCNKKKK